jgi:hypothetical protein
MDHLSHGLEGERIVHRYLISLGLAIQPLHPAPNSDIGPRLFHGAKNFRTPDVLCKGSKTAFFAEIKRKRVFSWHRETQSWQTGIDEVCYTDYRAVAELTQIPVWIFFMHESDRPDERDLKQGSPLICPTGLFGGRLDKLVADHSSARWGKGGMVYWDYSELTPFATLEDLEVFR